MSKVEAAIDPNTAILYSFRSFVHGWPDKDQQYPSDYAQCDSYMNSLTLISSWCLNLKV